MTNRRTQKLRNRCLERFEILKTNTAKEPEMAEKLMGRPIEILLVEDSPTDVLLTQEALENAKVLNNLQVVDNGEEAIAFLRRRGRYADKPRPDLILLDLNLPRKDGREVLLEIKADRSLKTIPVVVLTTSSAEEDVLRAYDAHANCFISKPVDFEQFARVVKSIEDFWFHVVVLPPRDL
jgi:two-component system, chemotaxis family, response regulator Rcp1